MVKGAVFQWVTSELVQKLRVQISPPLMEHKHKLTLLHPSLE